MERTFYKGESLDSWKHGVNRKKSQRICLIIHSKSAIKRSEPWDDSRITKRLSYDFNIPMRMRNYPHETHTQHAYKYNEN